ncbi:MAG: tetratricopeptide repeat protein, partial [Acidobacteriota bacterium]|nr:tetratricopeptide repeat protein [Acidobacteriota bacterium]
MNFTRLALISVLLAVPVCAASKETILLQRDVAQLQEQVRLLQQSIDSKMSQIQVLAQQSLDSSAKANSSVADLARAIQASGSDMGKQVLQPMATLGTRIDGMAQDLQSVQAGVADQNARMAKMQQQLVDIKNALSAIPPPSTSAAAPLPGLSSSTRAPESDPASPPISASQLWQNAKRDMDGGNADLALNEFADYLRFYRTTDLAPNAQFNIGQIHYSQKKLDEAVKDFDQVLEAFPTNPKTPDAHYMKGRALIQLGQRNEAAREFNAVLTQFPSSPVAANSKASLKALGMNPPAAAPAPV